MAVRLDETGTAKEIPVAQLKRGDLLLIRPGAGIPADGVVKEGTSAVNEAMITGESKPMDKTAGAKVIAGTVNGQGSDRKSTRLNSSHVAISYAVFCLKKKKQYHNTNTQSKR